MALFLKRKPVFLHKNKKTLCKMAGNILKKVGLQMILTMFHGFCMALADSVPGVSGGTVAFILGFYDRFLSSLHALFAKNSARRKEALPYLAKLAAGWVLGMAICAAALSGLFEKNIYFMSSLFLGLTAASLPFIAAAERSALKKLSCAPFAVLGAALVAGLTALRGVSAFGGVSFTALSPLNLAYLFFSGALAITAMVLPGISGSSLLLIAGVYLPTIQALHSLLRFQLAVLPGLCALGLGVLAGAAVSIHGIHTALQKYRSQIVWLIVGLMLGSFYAIINGPASLDTPLPPLDMTSFRLPAFLLGAALLLALELFKQVMQTQNKAASTTQPLGGERKDLL